ncbi:MAG: GntP family permease [Cyclobacteriaceae bacterium]|nr:GntP family permease [Cyclobacteriaceae bacterium]
MLLLLFAACILLLLILVTRFKVHPFIALLLVSIFFGFLSGMQGSVIISSIIEGFGNVMGKTGLIILFGVILGSFLEASGGAYLLAERILQLIGKKFIHAAILLTGYIVCIPVFADSGFVMLSSLNKTLANKAKVSLTGAVAALALGLMTSHVLVPPTPGPIAAAGIIGADLGKLILFSIPVSLFALIPSYFFSKYIGTKIHIDSEEQNIEPIQQSPPLFPVLMALLLPMLLIILKSIGDFPSHPFGEEHFFQIISFIGNPVIALLTGALLSMFLIKNNTKGPKKSDIITDSLKTSAPILLITGAGGIFGTMLQNSGIMEVVKEYFLIPELKLILPFLLSAVLKTAQGSSTVAIVTTAAIIAPLVGVLGIDTENLKVLAVLAIGSGAAVTSHVNDSYFWVICQMSGFSLKQGLRVQSVGSFLLGVSAMVAVLILSLFI